MPALSAIELFEQTIPLIVKTRQAGKTGWNFKVGRKKLIIKEMPRVRKADGSFGDYRFQLKLHNGRAGWVGALGVHKFAPVAIKIAFELALDDHPRYL